MKDVAHEIADLRRMAQRERDRSRVLEALTTGAPLAEILDLIARLVEADEPSVHCSILLMDGDGRHLRHGAAPSLPEYYNHAVDGLEIGDGVGSCGTAAFTKRRVIVEDIVTHPYWNSFRDSARKANLRSCWSEPILSFKGEVLGTFAVYHAESVAPSQEDIERITSLAHLAGLAIERSLADEGIRCLNAHLEDQVRERTRQMSQAMAELRKSQEHYRLLFNGGHDAVFVHQFPSVDNPGRFLEVNDVACRRLGYGREELLRMSPAGIDAPCAPADRQRVLRLLQEQGQAVFETVHVARDGERIPVEVSSRLLDLDGNPVVLSVARDIGERIRREVEYRAILQSAIDGFCVANASGNFIDVNDAYCRMVGYERDELLGMSISDVEDVESPGETQSHIEGIKAAGSDRFLTRHRRKDGVAVDVEVSVRWSEVRAGAVFFFVQDVTERIRAEVALRERVKWAEGLQRAGDDLASCSTVQAVADVAARAPAAHLGLHRASVTAASADGGLSPMASYGVMGSLSCPECFRGVMGSGRARLVPDLSADAPSAECVERGLRLGFRSCASFPIVVHQRCVAVLTVNCAQSGADTPLMQNVPLMEVFCRHVGHLWQRCLDDEELRKLSRAIEESPVSVVITNREGEIQYVNPRFCEVTGYEREEVLGQNPRILAAGHQPPEYYRTMWDTIQAGREWRGEFCNRKKSGELFWESASISPVTDEGGEVTHFVAVKEDVTERKRAEEALRKSREDLNRAQAVACVGSWRLDIRHDELTWSDETHRIFGVPAGTPLTYETFLAAVHPQDLENVDRCWAAALHGAPYDIEHRIVVGNRVKWVREVAELELDGQGNLLGGFGTVQDITERKQAEQQLAAARVAAEAASRAKSAFLSNMSHEIRTPMNAILGFTQLMLREPGLAPQQRERLETIDRSGEHLLALINDILEISRIEAGRATLNPTAFDLHALTADLERMFRVRTDAKRLWLRVEQAEGVPRNVVGDEGKLRQVLINLVGNAVKFTERGGITLRTQASRDGATRVRLLVEVEDTGPGISDEETGRLFRAFEQADSGRRAGTGTGLGLAISQEYIRLMGGEISVSSQIGEGSIFRFSIGLQVGGVWDAAGAPERRRVLGLVPRQSRCRVLVVDDHVENRRVLVEILRSIGFETREAADGEAAIAAFETWMPDLVLMDMRMPVMDGQDATRRIKSTTRGGHTPVIAVTAGVFEEDRRLALEAGADGFVAKPFHYDEVLEVVGAHLGIEIQYAVASQDDPAVSRAVATPPLTSEALALLPSAIVDQIRDAVTSLDQHRLIELIGMAEQTSPQVAHLLRELAESFQYDALLEVLQTGSPET